MTKALRHTYGREILWFDKRGGFIISEELPCGAHLDAERFFADFNARYQAAKRKKPMLDEARDLLRRFVTETRALVVQDYQDMI